MCNHIIEVTIFTRPATVETNLITQISTDLPFHKRLQFPIKFFLPSQAKNYRVRHFNKMVLIHNQNVFHMGNYTLDSLELIT